MYIDKEVIEKNNGIMVKIVNGNIDVIGSSLGYGYMIVPESSF